MMLSRRMRFAPALYACILALLCFGYAKVDNYQLDGDAVGFMDISDAIRAHDWALVANAYWNPAYAAVLALFTSLAHPTRWTELAVFYWANFFIAIGCIVALFFFVQSVVLARQLLMPDAAATERDGVPALSPAALSVAALALLFTSFQRELPLAAVRSDTLLLFFLLLAGGCLVRLVGARRVLWCLLLGVSLGCAYLTKSFAFLPSVIVIGGVFLFGATRKGSARTSLAGGAVLAGVVFLALSAPYIHAISEQRGRLTIGDSGRMNYAFSIDGTDRWHEAYTGRIGHATAAFKHKDHVVQTSPVIYDYDQHPVGTYPPWFDPSYWADGLKPRLWIPGQLARLVRTSALLVRYLIGRLEFFILAAVLLAAGCFFPRQRRLWSGFLPILGLGALVFAIYMLVDIQDRYMTGGFFLLAVPLLALLRRPRGESTGEVANAAVLLLAGLVAATALSDVAERRRQMPVSHIGGPYDQQTWEAAKGLEQLGITPGSPVACMGEAACVQDFYWARLSRTPIRAQVAVEPEAGEAGVFWRALPNQQQTLDTLRGLGMRALVAVFAPSAQVPAGWHQLGSSNFYAYPLGGATAGR